MEALQVPRHPCRLAAGACRRLGSHRADFEGSAEIALSQGRLEPWGQLLFGTAFQER